MFVCFCEAKSCYVAQAGLERTISLAQAPRYGVIFATQKTQDSFKRRKWISDLFSLPPPQDWGLPPGPCVCRINYYLSPVFLFNFLFSDTDSPSCPGGLELLRPPEIPGWLPGGMSRKTSKLEIETSPTGSSMLGSRDTLKIAMWHLKLN